MGLKSRIKDNRFVRGLYTLYRRYFGYSRKSFGYLGENAKLIPPLKIFNPNNIFMYVCN